MRCGLPVEDTGMWLLVITSKKAVLVVFTLLEIQALPVPSVSKPIVSLHVLDNNFPMAPKGDNHKDYRHQDGGVPWSN